MARITKTALEQKVAAEKDAMERHRKERIDKAKKLLEEIKISFARKAPLAAKGGDLFGIDIYDGGFIYPRGWLKDMGSLPKLKYLSGTHWFGREDHIPLAVYWFGHYLKRKHFVVSIIEYGDGNTGLLFKW